jgi:hypothetical protein
MKAHTEYLWVETKRRVGCDGRRRERVVVKAMGE